MGLSFYLVVACFLVSLALPSGECKISRRESPILGDNVDFVSRKYDPTKYDSLMSDEDMERRNKVKEMMKQAWDNYTRNGWGKVDDPTRDGHSFYLTTINLGTTIISAMDTLYIMDMTKEFDEAREWISKNFTLDGVNTPISVSEATVQLIGGLLSCFALTGDTMFRDKAQHVADKLLPAFSVSNGLPHSYIIPSTGSVANNDWTKNRSFIAEVGSFYPEFAYLSDLTDNPIYINKVNQIRNTLKEEYKPDNPFSILIDPITGKMERCNVTSNDQETSLEAFVDSFYEFLWKTWLINKDKETDSRQMFDEAISPIIYKTIKVFKGITYAEKYCDVKFGSTYKPKMDQLACFSGGLFALTSATLETRSHKYIDLAKILTDTCREIYNKIDIRFQEIEDEVSESTEKPYILSSETIGSYLILWRVTKDQKYREWGWEELQAIEKNCPKDESYAFVRNVCSLNLSHIDIQRGYFLSETLKYLYLLFSDDKLISQKYWFFNAEGHPLPVKERRYYRKRT